MEYTALTVSGYHVTNRIAEDPRTILYEVRRDGERAMMRVLLAELAAIPRVSAGFLQSAQALGKVHHDAVVSVLGSGKLPDGRPYILLGASPAKLLSDVLAEERRPAGLALLRQITAALGAIHAQGLLYLGLQPERVLISAGPDEPRAQLMDVETLRGIEEAPLQPTLVSSPIFNPYDPIYYMAPEHFTQQDVGPPADVYALGALAYHLLGGHPPCSGDKTGAVIAAHIHQVPPPLGTGFAAEVRELVSAMLHKDPSRRPTMPHVERELLRLEQPPPAQRPTTPAAAPQRFGDYQVSRLIGEGGMGQVYEAFSPRLQRRAAIKVIRPEICHDPRFAGHYLDEVRAANTINHPGIVTILQAEQTADGNPYIVMEYLDGESLRARIKKRRGPMPAAEVARLAWQLALTLDTAHQRGVIHRDLKPENVMILPDRMLPGGERTKVMDFGMAKLAEVLGEAAQDTGGVTPLGSPAYMPPEQFVDADSVDARADVYALGVMMGEMLAGKIGPLRPDHLPPKLAELIERMRSTNPEGRPSMSEVAAALEDPQTIALAQDAPIEPDVRPESQESLHKALDLYTRTEQWQSAMEVLDRLIALAEEPRRRGKFQHTAGVILRDALKSPNEAIDRFNLALDCNFEQPQAIPASEIQDRLKPFKDIEQLCRQRMDWKGLVGHYQAMIRRMPQRGHEQVTTALRRSLEEAERRSVPPPVPSNQRRPTPSPMPPRQAAPPPAPSQQAAPPAPSEADQGAGHAEEDHRVSRLLKAAWPAREGWTPASRMWRPGRLRFAAKTAPGSKSVRDQDFLLTLEQERLYLVLDGEGTAGAVAAQRGAEAIRLFYQRARGEEDWDSPQNPQLSAAQDRLARAIQIANRSVRETLVPGPRSGPAVASLVGALFEDDQFHLAWLGSARAYRLRMGTLELRTRDDTTLQDLWDAGATQEELQRSPRPGQLVRALGMQDTAQISLHSEPLEEGDLILLCSDGLSGSVDGAEIRDLLCEVYRTGDLETGARALLAAAGKGGGEDDVTVILVQCG